MSPLRRVAHTGTILGAALLLTGCLHESAADRAPRTDPTARLAPAAGPPVWREDLGDPALGDLLRRTEAGALDIKIALARLEAAQAELSIAGAPTRPALVVGAEGAGGGRKLNDARTAGHPTLEATYELDLGGRVRRLRAAARLEDDASAADVAYARLLVGAETAQAWEALRSADGALAAANRSLDAAHHGADLARARLGEGFGLSQDIEAYGAAADAACAEARAARLDAGRQAERLRILMGGRDQALPTPGQAPPALPPAPAELPASTADTRPDVQAAFSRLKAADERRAGAVAAARPQFVISALIGAPDAEIATLLDTRALAWAVAGRLGETLLDGGAQKGRIRSATAEADIADLNYRKTVLQAWSEMRLAVQADAAAGEAFAAAQRGVDRARAGLQRAQTRHSEGAADGLALAQAEASLDQAQGGLRAARLQAAQARIQRALASGGQ